MSMSIKLSEKRQAHIAEAGAIVAKGTLSSLTWRRLYVADNA